MLDYMIQEVAAANSAISRREEWLGREDLERALERLVRSDQIMKQNARRHGLRRVKIRVEAAGVRKRQDVALPAATVTDAMYAIQACAGAIASSAWYLVELLDHAEAWRPMRPERASA